MRPPAGILILLLVVSCTGPAPQVEAPAPATTATTTTTTAVPDPADPEVARRLGAAPPDDVDWRRTVAGLTVVGIGTRPVPEELALIEAAVAEMPPELHRVATPRTIVRVPDIEEDVGHEEAAAYARGADVYFLDRTFRISPGGSSRMDVARAYAHELAHVAQYLTLRPDYLRAVLEGRIRIVDPQAGSSLVHDFAAATGWLDRSGDPLRPDWHLPAQVEASTDYGRTRPDEDMAEAVAMVVMGRGDWIPADRSAWVERWLGSPAERLATGKPWAPPGSREVLSDDPLFDEGRTEALREEPARVEPLYFALPATVSDHAALAEHTTGRLRDRGLQGALERSDDARLPRWAGLFTRADGVAFWVELWDFRGQTGFREAPDHPVLTYVVLW